jgi:nucleotide-binding universal stress UspA family protein
MDNQPRVVVAGVEDSRDAWAALDWAAAEAAGRQRPLRLVHVLNVSAHRVREAPQEELPGLQEAWRQRGQRLLEQATRKVAERHPTVPVMSAIMIAPSVAAALLAEAGDAELIVVGARGSGGFPELLLGSVGGHLATHANRPVVVVRRQGTVSRGVVVGVDAGRTCASTLAFAFEEAALRGTGLTAIHAWDDIRLMPGGAELSLPHGGAGQARQARQLLAAALDEGGKTFPDVPVSGIVHRSGAAYALTSASKGAELVVVGSRGRGGFTGLLLGSVSHTVLHQAACTVAVVRNSA